MRIPILVLTGSLLAGAALAEPSKVADINAAARVGPRDGAWVKAMAVYAWAEGALYQVYAAPGRITDIALQPGEALTGPGPVAAGDTARWIIGDTESGAGAAKQVHVLVKPTGSDLATNLLITTDRRTYHLELRATATNYMAAVAWRYPADELAAIRGPTRETPAKPAEPAQTDFSRLNFGYRIEGQASWRPVRVFDDGRHVVIDFPPSVAQGEMPPIFVLSDRGQTPELVNYRVSGHRMIVDRLFAAAELRIGDRRGQTSVRLVREP